MAKFVSHHSKHRSVIVNKTDYRRLKASIDNKIEDIIDSIVRRLKYIGEQCIKVAREKGSYNDITGNLRSSIGFIVLRDGEPQCSSAFEAVSGKKGDGEAGVATGQALLQKIRGEYQKGIVLIVCAGMKYAAYVESISHKDVLASASLVAESLVNDLIGKFAD